MALKFFWLRRLALSRPAKILKGKALSVSRLVSGDTAESVSRKYILPWNATANIAGNLIGGNFLVGLYAILHVGDVLMGLITTLIQFCSIFQVFSPLLLDRFRRKKLVLLVTRIIYYTFMIVIIGLIPFLPARNELRIQFLVVTMILAYLINALTGPGYSVLHIRSIPREMQADFFSAINLLNYIGIYVFILLCGYVVDFFRNRGSFLAGITAVRVIALAFAAFEIYCHCHVHEFDEPMEKNRRRKFNPFLPLKDRHFTICTLLAGLYSFSANIPGLYYSSYLVNDVVVPYSFLGLVNFLSVPCMIIFIPFWNGVIKKISWFSTISLALMLVSIHYFILPFVNSGNYQVVYPIALIYVFSINPGISIVISYLPFYCLREEDRTIFIAFYAGFNAFMAMLGLFTGSLFIAGTGSLAVDFLGWTFRNKQAIMPLTGFLLMGLGFAYRFFGKKENL
jgi:MFS family permease